MDKLTRLAGQFDLCGAVTHEAEEDWARWPVAFLARASLSAVRTNGTSRIWSNSYFRWKAFTVFI